MRQPGTRVPEIWWEQMGIDWKSSREKAAAKEEDNAADVVETELTISNSVPESDTPGGTAGGTGEEASLEASGSSGVGRRRINLSGGDLKA